MNKKLFQKSFTPFRNRRFLTGFTLIELLVVLAISGLIMGLILTSVNNAKKQARDRKRLAELSQIKRAVQVYYSQNGFYPRSITSPYPEITFAYDKNTTWTTLEDSLKTVLSLIKLPKDPLSTPTSVYYYVYVKISPLATAWGNCAGHFVLYDPTAESSFRYQKQECPNSAPTLPHIIVDIGKY